MQHSLDLFSDHSERVPYNQPHTPLYVGRGWLSNFPNLAVAGHWHDDVEFSVILRGQMAYDINGVTHTIKQGQGLFINARQFHSHCATAGGDCEYICLLFHPVLLCANQALEQGSVAPVLSNHAFPHAILQDDKAWQASLMAAVQSVYDLYSAASVAYEMAAQSILFHMWSLLLQHMPETSSPCLVSVHRLTALRDMIGYLQRNYGERVTLGDIAAAGNVSPSTCCGIFREYLHQTPIQHLIAYRLSKSLELLKDPGIRITELALATGFSGVSYFSETFRKHFGQTPSEYRKTIPPTVIGRSMSAEQA